MVKFESVTDDLMVGVPAHILHVPQTPQNWNTPWTWGKMWLLAITSSFRSDGSELVLNESENQCGEDDCSNIVGQNCVVRTKGHGVLYQPRQHLVGL